MLSWPPPVAAAALLLLLLLLLVVGAASHDVHVSVMNRLGGRNNMTLHCQSKDNDLGQQTVPDGSEFGWDFSVNVLGTTLFFCDLGWQRVMDFHFDAYSFGRDFVRCGGDKCLWIVAKEGIYGQNGKTGLWEYVYSWSN